MGFIETSYGSSPNLSQVNIDSDLNMGAFSVTAASLSAAGESLTGNLDMQNNDIINIKRLLCSDYFGAVKATGSANVGYTAVLDNLYSSGGNGYKYSDIFFRIPSNIISGSSISITYTGYRLNGGTINAPVPYAGLYKLNADGTKTVKTSTQFTTATGETKTITDTLTVEGGELYSIYAYTAKNGSYYPGPTGIDGTLGLTIKYDLTAVLGVEWDIIDNSS